MEIKSLKQNLTNIKMTEEMKSRIKKNCISKMEENKMKNTNKMSTWRTLIRKPAFAICALALCLCVTGVGALAATGKLSGFFTDVTRWDGAVIGTVYENANTEMQISADVVPDGLSVSVTADRPDADPFKSIETISIEEYTITDKINNTVASGKLSDKVSFTNGKATIVIPADNLSSGKYTITVTNLIGSKKADKDLALKGIWKCEFSK